MQTSRVSVEYGSNPFIIVAPHGYQGDDKNTALIAERTAGVLNCNSIINHGWQRSRHPVFNNDKANCNDFFHMVDVVADEFLFPLLRTAKLCVKRHGYCIVIWLHGLSNNIRKTSQYNDIDAIFGNGAGRKYNSYTCDTNLKDFVICRLNENSIKCYDSIPGTPYSGFSENNMNQIWKRHYPNPYVSSFQLEIVKELREDDAISILTADCMSEAFNELHNYKKWKKPSFFILKKV
jgi:hypothetical protein